MKKAIYAIILILLGFSIAWATLWQDYPAMTAGTITNDDDLLVRDVGDYTDGPAGTVKRYLWSSVWTWLSAPSTDDTWQGHRMSVTAGEALSQWDLLYCKNSSGSARWYRYDCNGADKLYAPRAIALAAIASGSSGTAGIGDGVARNGGWGMTSNQDEGKAVYASAITAGGITLTMPSTSGDEVARVGHVIEENVILFSLGNITLVEVE